MTEACAAVQYRLTTLTLTLTLRTNLAPDMSQSVGAGADVNFLEKEAPECTANTYGAGTSQLTTANYK